MVNPISNVADIYTVSKLLGHASVKTTEKYYVDLVDDNYKSALDGLDKIINRKIYAEIPPRVEYSLTEKGESLMPIFLDLADWGKEHWNN